MLICSITKDASKYDKWWQQKNTENTQNITRQQAYSVAMVQRIGQMANRVVSEKASDLKCSWAALVRPQTCTDT